MTLDPIGIEIESNAPPIWEQDEDFSEVMSNQLKHAPWLAISILAHVIGGFILYFALDNPHMLKPEIMTAMEPAIEEDYIEDDEIETEDVKDEVTDDVDKVEPEFSEIDEVDNVINENISDSDPTAFRFDGTNPTVGLGGGAGGPFRRGGGGPDKGSHPRSASRSTSRRSRICQPPSRRSRRSCSQPCDCWRAPRRTGTRNLRRRSPSCCTLWWGSCGRSS